MVEALAQLLGIALAAVVFAVLARLAWRIGGLLGVPIALFLWACWGITVWGLLTTAVRMTKAGLAAHGLGG